MRSRPLGRWRPQRLAQVLINLLSNARDASPPGSAVRVKSEAFEHTVDLIVEDEGSGIPKNIMDRLFEPFFTTKDPGKAPDWALHWSIPSLKSIMDKSPSTARPIHRASAAPVSE